MSLFHYFITHGPLSCELIETAHAMHYSLDEVTKYVKKPRRGHRYYLCDPGSIYITTWNINWKEINEKRIMTEEEFLMWVAEECKKLGYFEFIKVWEDNTKCVDGKHEQFFSQCKHKALQYNDFCQRLFGYGSSLVEDVVYRVSCSNCAQDQDANLHPKV